MASRVIHYIVGQKVTERIHLQDRERFLFGNLLPDCVDGPAGRKGAKASSHFWEVDSLREARGQNWHLFWDKYESYRKDELYLGYMCHLVTDAIWLRNVIVPLKEANGGCHFHTTEILYRDYHRLNELLKQDFPAEFLPIKWLGNEIEEADSAFWEIYYQGLLDEWQEDAGVGKEDLELVDYDRICDFIREVVNVAAEEIEAKRENRPGRDPASFYAPNRLFNRG